MENIVFPYNIYDPASDVAIPFDLSLQPKQAKNLIAHSPQRISLQNSNTSSKQLLKALTSLTFPNKHHTYTYLLINELAAVFSYKKITF